MTDQDGRELRDAIGEGLFHELEHSSWLQARLAQAKAEALREWISEWPKNVSGNGGILLATAARAGLARAEELEREGEAGR